MEAYEPDKVFSSIDQQARYAYSNQPHAMHWNLARLAEALLPLLVQEEGSDEAGLASAYEALAGFGPQFEAARESGLRRKLGLFTEREGDAALAEDLLERMAANRADFTLTFRRLTEAAERPEADAEVRALFTDGGAYDAWAGRWRERLTLEHVSPQERASAMRLESPMFIPRNHLVEKALDAAMEREDFQTFEELLEVGSHPYDDHPEKVRYATPARPEECVRATFCGT